MRTLILNKPRQTPIHWANATLLGLLLLASATCLQAAEDPQHDVPSEQPITAKIRFTGIFIKHFKVTRIATMDCNVPKPKPWLVLDCGLLTCPKPSFIGIPLPPNYTNLRNSPRITELALPANEPLTVKLSGSYEEAENLSWLTISQCDFNVSFIPQAGRMYELALDPVDRRCGLSVSEIAPTNDGFARIPVQDLQAQSCSN